MWLLLLLAVVVVVEGSLTVEVGSPEFPALFSLGGGDTPGCLSGLDDMEGYFGKAPGLLSQCSEALQADLLRMNASRPLRSWRSSGFAGFCEDRGCASSALSEQIVGQSNPLFSAILFSVTPAECLGGHLANPCTDRIEHAPSYWASMEDKGTRLVAGANVNDFYMLKYIDIHSQHSRYW